MSQCFPFASFLRHFRCRSRNRRCGKRPETFLTPYEMDMVPVMIKELMETNPRFFEVVCFRWFKEVVASGQRTHTAALHPTKAMPVRCDDFDCEARELRGMLQKLAKTLMHTGGFDDECETVLETYRHQREEWRCAPSVSTTSAPMLLRSRSFSAAVAAPPLNSSRSFKSSHNGSTWAGRGKRSRQRAEAAAATDALFVQLGEVLVHQFQCAVTVEKGNVHERELKLLIWRHFVQMLVAVLTDRARFPA